MKKTNTRTIYLSFVLIASIFTSSCDSSFYLTEKEFYALRWQVATQNLANQFFGGVQGQQIHVNFDNSVSPPRVQSSNLQDFMRNNLPTLAILEGYPSNSFRIDRVSGEIEKQFDNWLAVQLNLYSGTNNAKVRLERVEQIRVQFMNNPTFTYSTNKIVFNTTLQITADCRIRVDALDPVSNFLFGGVNGTYDVSIDINNMQLQGEITLDSAGDGMDTVSSDLQFKLTPTVGSVVARDRGTIAPTAVKNGIRDVVEQSLRNPLIDSIERRYNYFALSNCRINGEFTCEYDSRPATSTPELHAVARGTDNKLYSAIKRGGVWSGYTELCCTSGPLHILFTSDPTLTVSSANTVELVATTSSGELYYTQYQNGWKNLRFVLPPQGTAFRGKPAVVATAPGQLEVFVTRSDNKVLHLRRLNGVWTTPVLVNLPLSVGTILNIQFVTYRDPVAVQSGNKIVLTAVGSNHRLFTILYDMETGYWGQSSQFTSENIIYAPALASSGDGRVDLAYVGASGSPFHRTITISATNIPSAGATIGFSVNAETNLSGALTATPMLVASGYRQLDLVARGTDNRLYHKHFTGPSSPTGVVDGINVTQGWSGWTDLNGNFIGTLMFGYENTEEYALTATKSGKVDLVARIRANTPSTAYTLHHNSFDAYDYGLQPWKTVLWRGYDSIDLQTFSPSRLFNGRPALAALDTNFATAFVGAGNNIYDSQQGIDFAALSSFQVLSNPAPVDPVSVSSGKGLFDIVAVGTDSKLRHIRYRNNLMLQNNTLPGQTNLLFRSRPAVVGYGDGQIDLVGVATTGAIYHWRLVNGVWQNPRVISGTVSSPVLVNTGGGQLEFFAIGGDNKLYRWRFLGGVWGNWQQLPSAFTINPGKFGHGAATTAGDGTVDLAVVTNQAGVLVYHRLVEPRDDTVSLPNMPAQTFRSIGSMANYQPFISAAGKTEKFVIAGEVNSSDFKYFSLNNSTTWKSDILRGKSLGLLIGGIADLPTGAVAVAADINGKTYFHDRMKAIGPRSDFILMPGQSQPFWMTTPRYRPTVASFSGQ